VTIRAIHGSRSNVAVNVPDKSSAGLSFIVRRHRPLGLTPCQDSHGFQSVQRAFFDARDSIIVGGRHRRDSCSVIVQLRLDKSESKTIVESSSRATFSLLDANILCLVRCEIRRDGRAHVDVVAHNDTRKDYRSTNMFSRCPRAWSRRFAYFGLLAIGGVTADHVRCRYNDRLDVNSEFAIHTNEQHKRFTLSGMHRPYLTTNGNELRIFNEHFGEYSFLLGSNVDEIEAKHSYSSDVHVQRLATCPTKHIDWTVDSLVVGGPPALVSAVQLQATNTPLSEKLMYINDERRVPICNGSAWHLEEDAQTEAPTSYSPFRFLTEQLKRLVFQRVFLRDVQLTGEFPWRTIDWLGWLSQPDHWWRAIKIFVLFQWTCWTDDREKMLNKVAEQCRRNERIFEQLDEQVNGELLARESGSIILARNQQELDELQQLKGALHNEKRLLNVLTPQEMVNRYSFVPKALLFAEKTHDRVLVPYFMDRLKKLVAERGAHVVNGRVKSIYVDKDKPTKIVHCVLSNGDDKWIKCSRLILSLGNQMIYDQNRTRLFDVIAARGVSIVAHLYLPKGHKLPAVLVAGATNHLTRLSPSSVSIDQNTDLYLVRLTAGACITPNVCDQSTASYDSTIAVGLLRSVEKIFDDGTVRLEPLLIYGCNRQVSRHGQIHWFEPLPQVFVQYGAAGGGLTRAPDSFSNALPK
jgi:hypothetical protein